MSPYQLALVAVLAPLAAAVLLMVVRPLRHAGKLAAFISVLAASFSLAASGMLLRISLANPEWVKTSEWMWLPAAGKSVATIGLHLDGISVPMLVVVSLVALCVQVFSLEYMSDEPPADYGRYFTWHSLFLFSMQGLVIAPNLLQLFACWELVGLASYLLIGFYWTKPSAARAAVKAFWVTKFADMGLLLGLILQYVHTGSFAFDDSVVAALISGGAISWVAGLYFFAVMGKSAQFPLHIWLPDAMEGPTPVSALLHAATMVAAGVYLIVRAYPIFLAATDVLPIIACIGGLTAFLAGCIAVVQTDIKKVLAYSTCSQLGYMVAALGSGSLMGGYFHLTTHAFFKALLFLAAGSVIHGVHSNELSDMGGLFKKMPFTATVFGIGSLALMGFPFLSGFYSKDHILESLFHTASHGEPIYWIPLALCLAGAGLTAYYMGRVFILAFLGEPSEKASHAHESGWAMRLPLAVLAIGSIVVGYGGGELAHLWGDHSFHFAVFHVTPIGGAAMVMMFGGLGLSYAMHGLGAGKGIETALTPVGDFIRSAPIDRGWEFAYRQGLLMASAGLAWVDRYLIDGLMNASGAATLLAGDHIRAIQTGKPGDYVYVVALATLGLVALSQIVQWVVVG